jgi:uncharacterized protein
VILCDVNIYIGAHRKEIARHDEFRSWLRSTLTDGRPYGYSDLALSGFLRVVTNRRAFRDPTPIDAACDFATRVRDGDGAVRIHEGPRHWEIFARLCRETKAIGDVVPDAYFAALSIEHDCEWITADRGFARFPGLRWRHPLDG